jgi:hypothetical protein
MRNLNNQIDSFNRDIMAQELDIALLIQKKFKTILPRLYPQVKETLNAMLHAQNLEIYNIHNERLENFCKKVPDNESEIIYKYILALTMHRRIYLINTEKYLQALKNEWWTGLEILFATIPLIIGIFVPPVGIAMLVLTMIFTAVSIIGYSDKVAHYFDNTTPLGMRSLSEEGREKLKQDFDLAAVDYLAKDLQSPPKPPKKNLLFFLYSSALIISILGLLSLAFPPLGIPTIAVFTLTFVTIGLGVTKGVLIYDTHDAKKSEVRNLKLAIENAIHEDNDTDKNTPLESLSNEPCIKKSSFSLLGLLNYRNRTSPSKVPIAKEEEEEGDGEGDTGGKGMNKR